MAGPTGAQPCPSSAWGVQGQCFWLQYRTVRRSDSRSLPAWCACAGETGRLSRELDAGVGA
eukprot:5713806-Alexandrium_andersonii.AAC.1